eukprot:TRINITY_DN24807_c0_g1_i1.p2 TRINITY_DN24807_c0_g1~~TRINITY_DN24807_c0_g1_i1.p2  ORF type:complete len:143 (-),score=21.85 TRINITY_DN24807_c0_g1_i1:40-432(-)
MTTLVDSAERAAQWSLSTAIRALGHRQRGPVLVTSLSCLAVGIQVFNEERLFAIILIILGLIALPASLGPADVPEYPSAGDSSVVEDGSRSSEMRRRRKASATSVPLRTLSEAPVAMSMDSDRSEPLLRV